MRALDLERENAGAGGAVSGEEGSRPAAGKDGLGISGGSDDEVPVSLYDFCSLLF